MSDPDRRLVASSEALQTYLDQLFGQVREDVDTAAAAGSDSLIIDSGQPPAMAEEPDPALPAEDEFGEDLGALNDGGMYYLFEVAGLTLAIPLARFEAEVELPEVMTPPVGQDWRRIAETPAGPLIVVDTAGLILQESRAGFPDDRVSHLVVLDSGNWALAAHGPGTREELDLDRVHWRSTSGRRPWLAGTLPDRRCVLLDLDEIGMLAL